MKKRIYLVLETEADEDDKSILNDIEQELGMATHYFETVSYSENGFLTNGLASRIGNQNTILQFLHFAITAIRFLALWTFTNIGQKSGVKFHTKSPIGCRFLNRQRRPDTWQHPRSVVVADRR